MSTSDELTRIAAFCVEDILDATDEEIIAECIEDGENPVEVAEMVRGLAEEVRAGYERH